MNKRVLYESIMRDVSKIVKKHLIEGVEIYQDYLNGPKHLKMTENCFKFNRLYDLVNKMDAIVSLYKRFHNNGYVWWNNNISINGEGYEFIDGTVFEEDFYDDLEKYDNLDEFCIHFYAPIYDDNADIYKAPIKLKKEFVNNILEHNFRCTEVIKDRWGLLCCIDLKAPINDITSDIEFLFRCGLKLEQKLKNI